MFQSPARYVRPNTSTIAAIAPASAHSVHRHGTGTRRESEERAERRPARHAEHVGVGQRVSQEHLKERAGEREQSAARKRGEHARPAQFPDDVARHVGTPMENGGEYLRH